MSRGNKHNEEKTRKTELKTQKLNVKKKKWEEQKAKKNSEKSHYLYNPWRKELAAHKIKAVRKPKPLLDLTWLNICLHILENP